MTWNEPPDDRPLVCFYTGADPLSNFYPRRQGPFLTAEHEFQWRKARFFRDRANADAILRCKHPAETKFYGRRVVGFDPEQWAAYRDTAMALTLRNKYRRVELADILLATDDAWLVEASEKDGYWGAKAREQEIMEQRRWTGVNRLGELLMLERDYIGQLRTLRRIR